ELLGQHKLRGLLGIIESSLLFFSEKPRNGRVMDDSFGSLLYITRFLPYFGNMWFGSPNLRYYPQTKNLVCTSNMNNLSLKIAESVTADQIY
ncbi:hypothetical protein HID58_038473, partial [Brassica napus]